MTHIAMFAWLPLVILIFKVFEPRRAVIISFIVAWLFLPIFEYEIPGLPNYSKMTATCWGVLISSLLFYTDKLASFSLKIFDVPIIVFCLCPLVSSVVNGLGLYDGFSAALNQIVVWGFPYFIGRIYLNDLKSLDELALGFLIGGLIYVPLCFVENWISPQLHNIAYGFHQHDFSQTYRYGGWRPMVFMEHGLMVGVWMASASLIGLWLLYNKCIKNIFNIPATVLIAILLVQTILCRSTGALMFIIAGFPILFLTKKIKKPIFIYMLILVPIFYLSFRATGTWTGQNLVQFISTNLNPDRAASLEFRLDNENLLTKKARQKPILGWGGWGRSRVFNDQGEDITVTDGLWIIIFGENGLLGLSALALYFLLPCIRFLWLYPTRLWDNKKLVATSVLSLLLVLYFIDCLLNAMINPIFMLIAGSINGLVKEPLSIENKEHKPIDFSEELIAAPKTRFI